MKTILLMLFAFLVNSGSLALGATYDRAAHSATMSAAGVPFDQQLAFMSMASGAQDQKYSTPLLKAYDWMVATFGTPATWIVIIGLVFACGLIAIHFHQPRRHHR